MVGCKKRSRHCQLVLSRTRRVDHPTKASFGREEEREAIFSLPRSPLGSIQLSCILPSSFHGYQLAPPRHVLFRANSVLDLTGEKERRARLSPLFTRERFSESLQFIAVPFHLSTNDCSIHEQAVAPTVARVRREQSRKRGSTLGFHIVAGEMSFEPAQGYCSTESESCKRSAQNASYVFSYYLNRSAG